MPICANCGHDNPDGARFCNACAAPLVAFTSPGEQRKTVTVLFCDVSRSTALGEKLDPEALRALLARYFERMKAIVEGHGGTVEKFIGDAVMAVFGVPVVHEDDALRACRAAGEMRDAFQELSIEGRIGVTTGEVVTGTEERLATGDTVNVAARLEQAAQPGEILIGEATYRLTRDAVEVDEARLLDLKGKAKLVPAYPLVTVSSELTLTRRLGAPMVGRQREQRLLGDAWERVVSEQSCHLFTILGAAGVGKSRLAAEFLGSVEGATVVRGRSLPYGEGITYWPVVEVIKELPALELDEANAVVVQALLGDDSLTTSSDEIAWAFRNQLEAVSRTEPLICVFDDVHWGEETFLDLIEHVADLSRDSPILLLCMARPELLDRRTGWGGGKVNATTVLLEALSEEETDELISELSGVDGSLRARIRAAAEGNPLFVEEMVALAQESGDEDISVPPTIQALLAARLDQLDPQERNALQCGSVEGRVFHRSAVQALAPEEQGVPALLVGLVRKELVRPERAQLDGDDAFRFRHLLIRDAAYDALPKATRAALHERFALWLERNGVDLVEIDEIVGYHLEQACRYRIQLGTADEATEALARIAAKRLGAAGRRAILRKDAPAAINLISRAAALLPPDDPERIELVPNVRAIQGMTGDVGWADGILSAALESGDEELRARALVQRGLLRLFTDEAATADELIAGAEEAIRVFTDRADDLGLARAWRLVAAAHYLARHAGPSVDAAERALAHARSARDQLEVEENVEWLAVGLALGPTPAPEALGRIEPLLEDAGEDRFLEATLCSLRGSLTAISGRGEEAEESFARARRALDGRDLHRNGYFAIHLGIAAPALSHKAGVEREQRAGCDALEEMGEKTMYSTVAAMFSRTLFAEGRYDEAERYTRTSEAAAHPNDVLSHIFWRSTRAKILAHRGEFGVAEDLARQAVAFAEQSDFLNGHAEALMDLAEVLELAGKPDQAAASIDQALALYERKGNIVMAERARARGAVAQPPGASRS